MLLNDVAIGIKSFKCFGTDCATIPKLLPMNLIIGRNNSGKSAILDVLQYLCQPQEVPPRQRYKGSVPEVTITAPLDEHTLLRVFAPHTSGGGIRGDHWTFGLQYIGARLTVRVEQNKSQFISLDPPLALEAQYVASFPVRLPQASRIHSNLSNLGFWRTETLGLSLMIQLSIYSQMDEALQTSFKRS